MTLSNIDVWQLNLVLFCFIPESFVKHETLSFICLATYLYCKWSTIFLSCNRLSSLEYLSVDNNFLDELPIEICHLSKLVELHAANNRLKW